MIRFFALSALAICAACTSAPDPVERAQSCRDVPRFTEGALITSDCARLPGQLWAADNPRGAVVLLHNFGDFHEAFDWLGPELAAAGYSALAFDQRGFGSAGERGRWYGADVMESDAAEAVAVVRRRTSDVPIYVLGESMGGSIAMVLAAEGSRVDGLVLAAPGVREGIDYRWLWDAALWAGETFLPSYDVDNPRGDGAALADDARKRLANSSKIVDEVRLDTYSGLIDLTDEASAKAEQIRVPALLLYGGQDDTIDPVAVDNAKEALGPSVTYKAYPDAPHLLFQSIYRERILSDTLDWLESQSTR